MAASSCAPYGDAKERMSDPIEQFPSAPTDPIVDADAVTVEEKEVLAASEAEGADAITAEEKELLAAEARREQEHLAAEYGCVQPLEGRPNINIPVATASPPPHLGDDHCGPVAVPPDGLCLYHCATACQDLAAWVATHHPSTGQAFDLRLAASDLTEAWSWRERIVLLAREVGDVKMAQRLSLEGSAGYPDQDALPLLARLLGGQVVLQVGDVQASFGEGPLLLHLLGGISHDGAGHGSGHFAVIQSWLPRLRGLKRTRDGGAADSRGAAPPPPLAPLGAPQPAAVPQPDAAGDLNCADFLESLGDAAGGFAARPDSVDEVMDEDDIVKHIEKLRADVKAGLGDVPDVHKVAVVLLLTYRLRLLDMSMLQHVAIIYAIEGGEWMRSHNGTLFLYANGAWRPFIGVFPVSTMSRVRRVLLRAEGLLKVIGNAPRTAEGVLLAVRSTLETCATEAHWVRKVEDAVLDGRGEEEVTSWPRALASAIAKCSASLQGLLSGKRCVPFLIEWCETPLTKAAGFATIDSCYVFEEGGEIMKKVGKAPDRNIYMFLPRNMHDAVLAADVQRLTRFLTTTFFDNGPALQCHFAAFALVLRGHNIDRAFWTLGGGGVGQSLLSHLIATVFGDNHSFIDMNLYFTDDEMRKQGELLAGKAVVTGQEMPNETKEMREDLYKKHISADAVSCRLPYAVLTKQVQLVGLKRFEMNQTPRFRAASEANFNSIERRSLVTELRGEFVSESELQAAFPQGGAEAEGVFLKDPTLKAFLTSSGAVGAFLRLLEGFLKTRSEARCRDIIEDYVVGGGDRGLTRQVMRLACGLSADAPVCAKRSLTGQCARQAATVSDAAEGAREGEDVAVGAVSEAPLATDSVAPLGNAAPGTPAVAAPGTPAGAAPRTPVGRTGRLSFVERERASLRRDHVALVRLCLRDGVDMVNKSCVGSMTRGIWGAPSAKDRAAVFDKLLAHGFWVEIPKRNQMQHPCAPVLETEHPFESALPHPLQKMHFKTLPELFSVKAVQTFLKEDGRAANDTVMMQYLEQMAKGGARPGKGRLSKEMAAEAKEWAELSDKMQKHVHSLSLLRGWLRDQTARNAATLQASQPDVAKLTADYSCAIETWGRSYGRGLCFQALSRRARGAVRGADLQDWDISNCMFCLTVQVVKRLGLKLQIPEATMPTWTKYAEDSESVRDAIKAAVGFDAKSVLIKVAHGGSVPETGDHAVDELLSGISREGRLMRWLACSALPEVYAVAQQNAKKYPRPEATVFHYFWATVENQCLVSFARLAQMRPVRHLSLHFDGLLVDASRADASENFGAEAEATILADTAYRVKIARKWDRTFFEALRQGFQESADAAIPAAYSAVLVQRGRSVPLALAHATGDYALFAAAIASQSASRRDAYGEWSSVLLGVDRPQMRHLHPDLGLRVPKAGPCVLHAHSTGRPECMAVIGQVNGFVRIFDGQRVGAMPLESVHRAFLAASDRGTVVTYAFGGQEADSASALLLGLRAP